MKKAIYTAIFGNYDNILEPKYITPQWDYICFTDNKELKSDKWNIQYVELNYDNTRNARNVKILYQNYLKDYDLSTWIDSNIQINYNLDLFIKDYLNENSDAAFMMHPDRNCIYQEVNACIEYDKDDPEIIYKQKDKLLNENYPRLNGLIQTNIIIRKHTKELKKISEYWWNEVLNYSKRDQLSLNYILWKYSFTKYNLFSADVLKKKYFILHTHSENNKMQIAGLRKNYGKNYYMIYNKKDVINNKIRKLNKKYKLMEFYNIEKDETVIYKNLNKSSNILYLQIIRSYTDILNNLKLYTEHFDYIIFTLNDELNDELYDKIMLEYGHLFLSNIKIIKIFNENDYNLFIKENYVDLILNLRNPIYKQLYMLRFLYYLVETLEFNTVEYDLIVYSDSYDILNHKLLSFDKIDLKSLYFYKNKYWFGNNDNMNSFLQFFESFYNYDITKTFQKNVEDYMNLIQTKVRVIK